VTPGEQGDEHLVDHLMLTNDDLADLASDGLVGLFELLHSIQIAGAA
jgi:hypothetical protein